MKRNGWSVAGAVALCALLGSVSCQSTGVRLVTPPEFDALLRERGVEQVVVPFRVSDEMRQWIEDNVPQDPREDRKLSMLADALLTRAGIEVQYERDANLTAVEVFDERRANCLSFTLLFVGMARELGIETFFLQVKDLDSFEREGDLVILSDHIAVGYGPIHNMRIIDFAQDEPSYHSIRPLSDITAVALFYSNRGAEELRAGRGLAALEWLENAVKIDPELSGAWVNLGVVRRRTGNEGGAEDAYRKALEADPGTTSAYHNLAALLRMQGAEEEAADLLGLSTSYRSRNPYAYAALGEHNARHGRTEEAAKLFRRAVQLGPDQAEILASYGLFRLDRGERRASDRLLRRARKLDPESARVKLLERRLTRGRI